MLVEYNAFYNGIELGAAKAAMRVRESRRRLKYSRGDLTEYKAQKIALTGQTGLGVWNSACCKAGDAILACGGQVASGENDEIDPEEAVNQPFLYSLVTTDGRWNLEGRRQDEFLGALPNLVGHSMNESDGVIAIAGGSHANMNSMFMDVYIADVSRRTLEKVKSPKSPLPCGRLRHAACMDGNRLFIHGGLYYSSGNILLEDFWVLNLQSRIWTRLPTDAVNLRSLPTDLSPGERFVLERGPGKRFGHHMAFYRDHIFVAFGSDGSSGLKDLWAFNIKHNYWDYIPLREFQPGSRVDSASYFSDDGRWIFHGGIDDHGKLINSILEVNLKTFQCRQLRVEITPKVLLPALRGHTMARIADPQKLRLLILPGGVNKQGAVHGGCAYVIQATDASLQTQSQLQSEFPEFCAASDLRCSLFDCSYYVSMKRDPPYGSRLQPIALPPNERQTSSAEQSAAPHRHSFTTACVVKAYVAPSPETHDDGYSSNDEASLSENNVEGGQCKWVEGRWTGSKHGGAQGCSSASTRHPASGDRQGVCYSADVTTVSDGYEPRGISTSAAFDLPAVSTNLSACGQDDGSSTVYDDECVASKYDKRLIAENKRLKQTVDHLKSELATQKQVVHRLISVIDSYKGVIQLLHST